MPLLCDAKDSLLCRLIKRVGRYLMWTVPLTFGLMGVNAVAHAVWEDWPTTGFWTAFLAANLGMLVRWVVNQAVPAQPPAPAKKKAE